MKDNFRYILNLIINYFQFNRRISLTLLIINLLIHFNYCSTPQNLYTQENWINKSNKISIANDSFEVFEFLLEQKFSNSNIIILFEPLFFSHQLLYPTKDPIPYNATNKGNLYSTTKTIEIDYNESYPTLITSFQKNGFDVLLVKYNIITTATRPEIIAKLIDTISEKYPNKDIILGGLSLGGQYPALSLKHLSKAKIKKIFFIGTGLDYNYPGSLLEKSSKVNPKGDTICNYKDPKNLCNQYLSSIYIDKRNRNTINYPIKIPQLEKNPTLFSDHLFHKDIPIFLIYGKVDGISPEESILNFFLNNKKFKNIQFLEGSTANFLSKDYDHFDLFLEPRAEKELYKPLMDWILDK
jgi:hypothetical protein